MLAPEVIIFTPASLLGKAVHARHPDSEALAEIERRHIPLVLSTSGTRAQIEFIRRKIEHSHPFITESGGGLFLPDGYFALRLEGSKRAGRYLCVPFGRTAQEAGAALDDLEEQAKAEVVRYAEMNVREISRDTGMNERDAQASREREFSERFFFAGNADLAAFERAAKEKGWEMRRYEPFWELYSGNDEGKAVRYVMRLYREVLRSRIRSVGIGASLEDLSLLKATDHSFVLASSGGRFDDKLLAKLPNAKQIDAPVEGGWNQIVLGLLRER